MATRYLHATSGDPAGSTGSHASTHVDTDTSELKFEFGGAVHVAETKTAKTEVVTATNVITAAESGKVFFLNSATEFVSTLPAPAAGLRFSFIVKAAPSGASYTVVSASGTDNIHGMVLSAADAGGSGDSTAGTAADTITFVDGQAAIGDRVDIISDDTLWYAVAFVGDEDAVTFTAT